MVGVDAGIAALRVMALVADQRWPENAEQSHGACHAQDVPVVLVQRVHGAGIKLMGLSAGHLDDLATSRDAVVGLEMIRVLELELGAGVDLGQMQREFHAVVPT